MDLTITPLDNRHDRKSFDCGEPSLNQYLHRYANQDIKRRVNRVFIASPSNAPRQVTGYYSLSAGSLEATELPEMLAHRLPRYPLPVVLLGRLAVAKPHQGEGLGSVVLVDALQRIAQASHMLAIYAVVVDALNKSVAEFYRQLGFIPLPSQPLKLFMTMDTVMALTD